MKTKKTNAIDRKSQVEDFETIFTEGHTITQVCAVLKGMGAGREGGRGRRGGEQGGKGRDRGEREKEREKQPLYNNRSLSCLNRRQRITYRLALRIFVEFYRPRVVLTSAHPHPPR